MGWNRDDWLAAAFIIGIMILGFLAILWITGNIPQSDDTVFPFQPIPQIRALGMVLELTSFYVLESE